MFVDRNKYSEKKAAPPAGFKSLDCPSNQILELLGFVENEKFKNPEKTSGEGRSHQDKFSPQNDIKPSQNMNWDIIMYSKVKEHQPNVFLLIANSVVNYL